MLARRFLEPLAASASEGSARRETEREMGDSREKVTVHGPLPVFGPFRPG